MITETIISFYELGTPTRNSCKNKTKSKNATFALCERQYLYSVLLIEDIKNQNRNIEFENNRPFATNDHMVQNPPCWRASSLFFPHWDIKTKRPEPVKLDLPLF